MITRRALIIASPLLVALFATGWLLWTRDDPARQGGYCRNATVEIAALLRRTDQAEDLGSGPLPPVEQIFAGLDELDPSRFEVDTPEDVQADVAILAEDADPSAFARIVEDYLVRCRSSGTGDDPTGS